MNCKIDLETIGFFLYMEEQEEKQRNTDENSSLNENPFSWEKEPHKDGKED